MTFFPSENIGTIMAQVVRQSNFPVRMVKINGFINLKSIVIEWQLDGRWWIRYDQKWTKKKKKRAIRFRPATLLSTPPVRIFSYAIVYVIIGRARMEIRPVLFRLRFCKMK